MRNRGVSYSIIAPRTKQCMHTLFVCHPVMSLTPPSTLLGRREQGLTDIFSARELLHYRTGVDAMN
jgi:hypothetical protein